MSVEEVRISTEQVIKDYFLPGNSPRIIVTAGPTYEDIDAVRFLGNRSTGKQGIAIAKAAMDVEAKALLILGPSSEHVPEGVKVVRVRSALEMQAAVVSALPHCDALVMAAAVADYRPAEYFDGKIHKTDGDLVLRLERNPDILKSLKDIRSNQIVAGFSLDKIADLEAAKKKMADKGLDMIVANSTNVFAGETTDAVLLQKNSEPVSLAGGKEELAAELINRIIEMLKIQKDSQA